MSDRPLDVSILLNSETVTEWQRRALVALFESDTVDARPVVLVVNDEESDATATVRDHLSEFSLWKILRTAHLVKYNLTDQPWYKKQTEIESIEYLSGVETVHCLPKPAEELGNTFPENIIKRLAETDIAIRFGFGIVKGDALTAPTYGMVSYHHGDLRDYRGRPAGFHEFRRGEKTAGVTVQKLNESLDGGDIAAFTQINICDARSWPETLSRLYEASARLLPEAVKNCATGKLKTNPPQGDLHRMPTTRETLEYLREMLNRPYKSSSERD